jgi:hypothetical protein
MMEKIAHWLRTRFYPKKPQPLRKAGNAHLNRTRSKPPAPREANADLVEIDTEIHGSIEDAGPGKNVLIRNRFVREETGTHETLKIVDDSIIETGEEPGIDPYNTGGFDRSKKWDQRFRK